MPVVPYIASHAVVQPSEPASDRSRSHESVLAHDAHLSQEALRCRTHRRVSEQRQAANLFFCMISRPGMVVAEAPHTLREIQSYRAAGRSAGRPNPDSVPLRMCMLRYRRPIWSAISKKEWVGWPRPVTPLGCEQAHRKEISLEECDESMRSKHWGTIRLRYWGAGL